MQQYLKCVLSMCNTALHCQADIKIQPFNMMDQIHSKVVNLKYWD